MDEQMRDKLSGQIMNIRCLPACIDMSNPDAVMAYKLGHRDARHAAAELVTAAQGDKAELLEALQGVVKWADDNGRTFKLSVASDSDVVKRIHTAIAKAQGDSSHPAGGDGGGVQVPDFWAVDYMGDQASEKFPTREMAQAEMARRNSEYPSSAQYRSISAYIKATT